MSDTPVSEKRYYLVAWDLPMNSTRQRFYRKFRKIREKYSGSVGFMWIQQSLVITSSKKMAEEIYNAVNEVSSEVLIGEFIPERW